MCQIRCSPSQLYFSLSLSFSVIRKNTLQWFTLFLNIVCTSFIGLVTWNVGNSDTTYDDNYQQNSPTTSSSCYVERSFPPWPIELRSNTYSIWLIEAFVILTVVPRGVLFVLSQLIDLAPVPHYSLYQPFSMRRVQLLTGELKNIAFHK